MEGVGARFGRSSTRYGGPAPVFTGPVRKWKKKWVNVPSPNSNPNHHSTTNGAANGSNGSSHLQFYKWTPIALTQSKDGNNDDDAGDNGNANSKNSSKDDGVAPEEPPKRRFKYIPVVMFEDQINESSEQMEDENKQTDLNTTEATSGGDKKPDINDVQMDENQDSENNHSERQDLNESTLDLSLGLKAHDGENESEPRADQS